MSEADDIEAMALVIDPDAWAAIEDGRDVPGAFWPIRRDIARQRAEAAYSIVKERMGVMEDALAEARGAILKAAEDTLWCSDERPAETVVDCIDAALKEDK